MAPYDKMPDDSVPEPDDSPLGELAEAEPEEAAPSGELEELAAPAGEPSPPAGEAASGTEDGAEPPGEAEDGAEPPPAQRAESPFVRSVKRLWFRAANAFYAYCYFVGIQLLRTTRAKRRHVAHGFHRMEEEAAARRRKYFNRLRARLHGYWRDLVSPLTELREQCRGFSKAVDNARRYGTSRNVANVVLNAAGFWLKRLWRIFRTLLNYAAPIAACVLLYFTVRYFAGFQLALHVEYNGVDIGYVSNETVFTEAEKDMKERMILGDVLVADPTAEEEDTNEVQEAEQAAEEAEEQAKTIRPRFELTPVTRDPFSRFMGRFVHTADPSQLLDADELTNRLIRAVSRSENNPDGFAVEEATGLYIDGTYIGAVTDGDGLLDLLYEMKERYRTSDMEESTSIQFVKKVEVKQGLYPSGPNGSIRSLEEIRSLLDKEERGKKIYTVVSGDDPLKIAAKNGITLDELKAMNPGVDVSLFPGDELLIANSVPYLGVKVTETIRYEEELEYEITQRTDPDHDIGYYQIVQQGEKGVREVTAEIVMTDGVETDRNILNTTIVKEPVNQIVVVGGNRPLKVIPKDSSGRVASGAFQWPTIAGSINPGFLGYWGHTGSDISWSGCYGSPVLASADGTVVASGWRGLYGYCVVIDHGGGMQSLYAHCSALYVSAGQQVSQGETIAAIGATGNAYGPHLHFEIRVNGTPVDAAPYLYG